MPAEKTVGLWLIGLAILVYAMSILGGYTRLSGSGLSMVHWKPISGIIPPTSLEDWQVEFSHYKNSPEFKKVDPDMTLEGFKSIFLVEYFHRAFGRLIGIYFFIPFLYFLKKKKLRNKTLQVLSLGILGGLQGLLGWYMVKSGLVNEPSVSHYRLAAHLTLASLIMGLTLWRAMEFFSTENSVLSKKKLCRSLAWLLSVLIFIQVTSGGLVAGLHAGNVFLGLISDPFSLNILWLPELGLWNLTENSFTVLLSHLLLASIISVIMIVLMIVAKRLSCWNKTLGIYSSIWLLQVLVGVGTAMTIHKSTSFVMPLLHQAFGLALFCCSVLFLHSLKKLSRSS